LIQLWALGCVHLSSDNNKLTIVITFPLSLTNNVRQNKISAKLPAGRNWHCVCFAEQNEWEACCEPMRAKSVF
jgi:hypothetical protein